ncbi:asparagine synthase (glutamine-hydrolyzing) [Bradyrhizobium sp. BR 10289]|uniref:asparagine synthase (glutamine-hydrolyzing) n=1 Tax=Bradyrhizobium sp. BR 10289 TaxID=2749993 RepID=UPI001C6510E2|nr:asparagine synthase (glutamine-hydrolyzing) [Bradyrhizobium sp. BR 10289]MBW7970303.1 asparagine synthase (glutamine-hydrolyzing) [Bradyrhizobium sp. BR 10289]
MCGIVGLVNSVGPIDRSLVERMTGALAHRGPDDSGLWMSSDERVSLGHRRLAIIDLSPLGHQPMISEDGLTVIVFNGEIYNYHEVRVALQQIGVKFRSASDTEVVLYAYRVWGPGCLDRLVGMFAMAIWDQQQGRLFVARDRAGEKPLFYIQKDGRFAFASELKSLLVDQSLPRKVNPEALDDYLAYGYVSGGLCMLDGFAKLPAAHWLTYEPEKDRLVVNRYWDLPLHNPSENHLEDLTDELEALLTQSVRGQLVADVPVGVLLSGGLDSSLVAAAAARTAGKGVKTFTVSFPGHPKFDESAYARRVADFLGSEHTELVAEPASDELLSALIHQYDEPIADNSMIPTFIVSRAIRGSCTVALGGDGGDELFGGYAHHPWFLQFERLRRLGLHRLRLETSAANLVPIGIKGRSALLAMLSLSTPQAALTRLLDPVLRARLTSRPISFAPELRRSGLASGRTGIDAICAADFRSYMCDDILVKVDRASMLTSLELRAPMLDHRIVEFAFGRLSSNARVDGNSRKVILRNLAKRWLPSDFDSHRKQGFTIPIHSWFQGPWKHLIQDLLLGGSPFFDKQVLGPLISKLQATERGGHRLFQLIALELWRREYGVSVVT